MPSSVVAVALEVAGSETSAAAAEEEGELEPDGEPL